jgi:hypothetical protein
MEDLTRLGRLGGALRLQADVQIGDGVRDQFVVGRNLAGPGAEDQAVVEAHGATAHHDLEPHAFGGDLVDGLDDGDAAALARQGRIGFLDLLFGRDFGVLLGLGGVGDGLLGRGAHIDRRGRHDRDRGVGCGHAGGGGLHRRRISEDIADRISRRTRVLRRAVLQAAGNDDAPGPDDRQGGDHDADQPGAVHYSGFQAS